MAAPLNNRGLHVHDAHENMMMVPSPRSCVRDTDTQEFRFLLGGIASSPSVRMFQLSSALYEPIVVRVLDQWRSLPQHSGEHPPPDQFAICGVLIGLIAVELQGYMRDILTM